MKVTVPTLCTRPINVSKAADVHGAHGSQKEADAAGDVADYELNKLYKDSTISFLQRVSSSYLFAGNRKKYFLIAQVVPSTTSLLWTCSIRTRQKLLMVSSTRTTP
jgi:hypothetical protein